MRILPFLAVALLAAPLAAAAPPPPLAPGLWSVEARVVSIDSKEVPMLIRKMVEGRVETYERCVTPEEAAGKFEQVLVQKDASCRFAETDFADGKMRVRGRCASDKGNMTIDLEGRHTGARFTATSRTHLQSRIGAVNVTTAHVGTRRGACPA